MHIVGRIIHYYAIVVYLTSVILQTIMAVVTVTAIVLAVVFGIVIVGIVMCSSIVGKCNYLSFRDRFNITCSNTPTLTPYTHSNGGNCPSKMQVRAPLLKTVYYSFDEHDKLSSKIN